MPATLPITRAAERAIYAIARVQGWSEIEVQRQVHHRYGCTIAALSRRQGSDFIDWLKGQPREEAQP